MRFDSQFVFNLTWDKSSFVAKRDAFLALPASPLSFLGGDGRLSGTMVERDRFMVRAQQTKSKVHNPLNNDSGKTDLLWTSPQGRVENGPCHKAKMRMGLATRPGFPSGTCHPLGSDLYTHSTLFF